MSDEGFLGRWARLKQQQKRDPAPTPTPPAPSAPGEVSPATEAPLPARGSAPRSAVEEELAKRIAKLPRIEDLTVVSDFRVFMQDWVPAPLRTAALAKLWRLDPAIRTFEGPARDYGFDYVTPGAAPGYGPLGPLDDVRGQLARLFQAPAEDAAQAALPPEPAVRRTDEPADPAAANTPTVATAPTGPATVDSPPPGENADTSTTSSASPLANSPPEVSTISGIPMPPVAYSPEYPQAQSSVALQQKRDTATVSVTSEARRGRRHGGAIPS
ncbi:MAG: DUF3306 domain-containing protein [Alphaproteobacteria bacterium]|nr:MAG: DUF3306 domain-containing protein [Alphaproteobacteria bacterium]